MSVPTTGCCASAIVQQQQQSTQYQLQADEDEPPITPCKNKTGRCTVVENGRVVVKPLSVSPECK